MKTTIKLWIFEAQWEVSDSSVIFVAYMVAAVLFPELNLLNTLEDVLAILKK